MHKLFLNHIRKQLKASFVGYERYRDNYRLKVVVNKNTTYYDLDGTPDDVTPQAYNNLLQQINGNL